MRNTPSISKKRNTKVRRSASYIVAAIVFMAAPLVLFILNFRDQNYSTDVGDWGAFSDYLNPFVAVANLLLVIYLSIEVHNYNKKQDEYKNTLEKPVLVLNGIEPGDQQHTWELHNIGNGAALNIRVSSASDNEGTWDIPVRKCYSLGKGDILKLDFLRSSNLICVTFQDIFESKYVTIAGDSESHIRSINKFVPIQIGRKKFELSDVEKFLLIETKRLYKR